MVFENDKRYIILFIFITTLIIFYYTSNLRFYTSIIVKTEKTTKYILYWSPFWHCWDYFIGYGYQPFENCKYKDCFATKDRNLLPLGKFDALIFHATYNKKEHGIPLIRSLHQKYIFMNVEPPIYISPNLKQYKSYFNWTMSYRFDSDIVRRYGYIIKEKTGYVSPSIDFINNKTGLAAWFAFNCKTKSYREKLVEEIQKYISVDVYGGCGTLTWPHKSDDQMISSSECYAMVEKKYKFYFSFENSFCKDYSTEKLYNILMKDVIPVVYGYGNYKLMVPPNSIINIEDFDSVKQLVKYLVYLDQNTEEYLKFFEWKKQYRISNSQEKTACQICEKLNEPLKLTVYNELEKWWWGENKSICKIDKMLPKIVSDLLRH